MPYVPHRRLRVLLLIAAVFAAALALLGWDSSRRRAARAATGPTNVAVVRLLGFSDLALSSGARWLRHPSQTEAGAPFADLPGAVDIDPAGAAIGPPRPILRVGGTHLEVRAGGSP